MARLGKEVQGAVAQHAGLSELKSRSRGTTGGLAWLEGSRVMNAPLPAGDSAVVSGPDVRPQTVPCGKALDAVVSSKGVTATRPTSTED